jgi:hypothetical protein
LEVILKNVQSKDFQKTISGTVSRHGSDAGMHVENPNTAKLNKV